ncbi:MAG: chromosome partitioning protein ParA [Eggerthellaceae bacterium]|nr:chromosome partitioning protein ParA [Eggerthellaceae bacterium]
MMMRAALCIDDAIRIDPGLVGLAGESLDGQGWLEIFTDGEEARAAIAQDEAIERAWVVSSNDVEPINLAATLKSDRADLLVSLVCQEACGSMKSRAHNASIDEVVETSVFVRQYGELKGRNAVALATPVEAEVVESARPKTALHAAPARVVEASRSQALAMTQASAFVLPVVSGSGGAGKSSVAVVGAYVSHAMGYRTLLLDYDLQFGDVALLAGVAGAVTVDEAMARPELFDRERERVEGPVVLAAPRRLESAELVVRALPDHWDDLVSGFDVVIANTGAAWAEQHAALLERSSAALFLVDQRATSIRACRHALELCSRCGIATGPFRYAVNRCSKSAPLTSIDVSCALRGAPVFEIKDGGRDVEEFLSAGSPGELIGARNDFCASLEQLLAKLLPDGERRQAGLNSARAGKDEGRRARHVGRKWGRSKS